MGYWHSYICRWTTLVNCKLIQFGLFTVPDPGTMGLLSLHPGTMDCQPGDNKKLHCHCSTPGQWGIITIWPKGQWELYSLKATLSCLRGALSCLRDAADQIYCPEGKVVIMTFLYIQSASIALPLGFQEFFPPRRNSCLHLARRQPKTSTHATPKKVSYQRSGRAIDAECKGGYCLLNGSMQLSRGEKISIGHIGHYPTPG